MFRLSSSRQLASAPSMLRGASRWVRILAARTEKQSKQNICRGLLAISTAVSKQLCDFKKYFNGFFYTPLFISLSKNPPAIISFDIEQQLICECVSVCGGREHARNHPLLRWPSSKPEFVLSTSSAGYRLDMSHPPQSYFLVVSSQTLTISLFCLVCIESRTVSHVAVDPPFAPYSMWPGFAHLNLSPEVVVWANSNSF